MQQNKLIEKTNINNIKANKREDLKDLLMNAIIILVTFRGFIDNFIISGTLLVDAVFVCILIWCVIRLLTGKINFKYYKYVLLYLFWIILCCIIAVFQVIANKTTFYAALIGIRSNNIYTLLFLFVILFCNKDDISRYYKLFINCGIVICLFAIFQFLGRNWLPEKLLILKDEDVFTLYESGIIRVTGLMGNTIIFGGYSIVLFSLVWADLIVNSFKSVKLWIKLIIIVLANLLTFSRASVAGMVGVFALELIIYGAMQGKFIRYFGAMICLLFIALILTFTVFRNSIVVQRILGLNPSWNSGSDEGHFAMIAEAINVIKMNWLFGIKMGVSNEIITDGCFWAYIVEWGVFVFGIYCIVIIMLVYRAIRIANKCDKWQCKINLGYIGIIAYFFIFSFINSAYSARSIIIFVWMIAGMMLVSTKEHIRKNSYIVSRNTNV